MNTSYRLASKDDMISIYDRFDITRRIGWPVIVAERRGKIIGFLGTQDNNDYVIAGPVEVKLKVKAFVLKKLIEIYDAFMKGIGIKEYLFYVEKDKEKWIRQINETGLYQQYSEDKDRIWFKRVL